MNMLFPVPGTEAKKAVLYDVLYVPKLTCNLFSVRAAVAKGNAVEFGPDHCRIWDENGKLRGKGSLSDKLYQLDCQVVSTGYASVAQSRSDLCINVSDMCTCHASRNVFKINLCKGLTSTKLLNCHFAKDVWQERCVENRFP